MVVLQQGKGAFVTAPQRGKALGTRRKEIVELAKRLLSEAAGMGASSDEVVEVVRSVAKDMGLKR